MRNFRYKRVTAFTNRQTHTNTHLHQATCIRNGQTHTNTLLHQATCIRNGQIHTNTHLHQATCITNGQIHAKPHLHSLFLSIDFWSGDSSTSDFGGDRGNRPVLLGAVGWPPLECPVSGAAPLPPLPPSAIVVTTRLRL
jgi:hypothetical protein